MFKATQTQAHLQQAQLFLCFSMFLSTRFYNNRILIWVRKRKKTTLLGKVEKDRKEAEIELLLKKKSKNGMSGEGLRQKIKMNSDRFGKIRLLWAARAPPPLSRTGRAQTFSFDFSKNKIKRNEDRWSFFLPKTTQPRKQENKWPRNQSSWWIRIFWFKRGDDFSLQDSQVAKITLK